MRGHAQTLHFLHLEVDVGVDHAVAEHAAAGQELAVLVEGFQRFFQRGAHGRDQLVFFRRQVVQVLGRGFARVDLVLDAVQACHQQRSEAQVDVGQRVREAGLDAAAFRVRHVRDADRGRTVAGRVGQLDRGFIARHQALVRVGARVGDRVQGACVLDDAADVEQRGFRQACIAVAGEQVLAVFPDRLVHVHARAVVAVHWLRHEGRGLAVAVGHVPDHVLQVLGPVGALDQGREFGAEFILAGAGHFVVVHFDRDAHRFEDQRHFRTHVLEAVDRRDREVAALDGRTVAAVAAFDFLVGRPGCFLRVDLDEAARHVDLPADRVEDEEFRFRAEVGGVAQAGRLQVGFGALGDRARVAVVALAVRRFDHVALHEQRGLFHERVEVGGVRVRQQQHVGGFDALPAGDRRTVEGVARFELVFVEVRHGDGHVLLLAAGVREAQVNELHFVVFDELNYVCNRLCHSYLLIEKGVSHRKVLAERQLALV
ncbi:conserved hypothetical protein [Massilia sp. 9I]|nr:conserved hypothetical protein [Massilia sp. 9I]